MHYISFLKLELKKGYLICIYLIIPKLNATKMIGMLYVLYIIIPKSSKLKIFIHIRIRIVFKTKITVKIVMS